MSSDSLDITVVARMAAAVDRAHLIGCDVGVELGGPQREMPPSSATAIKGARVQAAPGCVAANRKPQLQTTNYKFIEEG